MKVGHYKLIYSVIIALILFFVLYIIGIYSGIIYFTKDIKNVNIEQIEDKLNVKFPNRSMVLKMTKVLGVPDIYAQISIPYKNEEDLIYLFESNNKYSKTNFKNSPIDFKKWCNIENSDIEKAFIEEILPENNKSIKIKSIVIFMKPENDKRTVYVYLSE